MSPTKASPTFARPARPTMAVAAALGASAIFLLLFFARQGWFESKDRIVVRNQAILLRDRLESAFRSEIDIAVRLAGIVERRPSISAAELDTLAFAIVPEGAPIASLSVAPNAVVAWHYPRSGGESLKGHDLLSNPERRRLVVEAIDTKSTVCSGPDEAVDGSFTVSGRHPVFIEERGREKLWGIVSVTLDFRKVLQATGIRDENGGLRLVLSGLDPSDPTRRIPFWGRREVLSGDPLSLPVRLPGLSWELAAVPLGGWSRNRMFDLPWLILGLCSAAALFIVLMRKEIGPRNAESGPKVPNPAFAAIANEIRRAATIRPAPATDPGEGDASAAADDREPRPSRSLLDLVQDLERYADLAPALPGTVDAIEFDPRALVSGVAANHASHASLRETLLTSSVESGIPDSLRGDPAGLAGILETLVGESISATSGGEISIVAILGEAGKRHAVIRFVVRDSGSTPDPRELARIFEPFSDVRGNATSRYCTNGLSLALAYREAVRSGSSIECEALPEGGLQFRLTQRFATGNGAGSVVGGAGNGGAGNGGADGDTDGAGAPGAWAPGTSDSTGGRELRSESAPGTAAQETGYTGIRSGSETGAKDGLRPEESVPAPFASVAAAPDAGGTGGAGESASPRSVASTGGMRDHGPVPATHQYSPRILLAEDGEVNRQIILRMLGSRGYRADTVTDGRQALAACLRDEYDLVFMDCIMPGMDGFESTSRIRQLKGPGRPVVIGMNASVLESERTRCFDSGMDDVIAKPFTMDELVRTIRRHAEPD